MTVSWAVCITQLLIKILWSYGIDLCASIMQNNNIPFVPNCAIGSASTSSPSRREKEVHSHGVNEWSQLCRQNMHEIWDRPIGKLGYFNDSGSIHLSTREKWSHLDALNMLLANVWLHCLQFEVGGELRQTSNVPCSAWDAACEHKHWWRHTERGASQTDHIT